MKTISVARRPYHLLFPATGTLYPLSAEEADRLVAEYPVVKMTANRLTLRADDGQHCVIRAATRGGGPAFTS